MSAKTCQLCGKPLGRKADGEFCSPEHRNQSRLRRGMDRLEEANKVASLMRRRENPRPIPAEQLTVLGTAEPVASVAAAPFPVRNLEPRFTPLKPALFEVRIAVREQKFASPVSDLSRRSSAAASGVATTAALPFASRKLSSDVKKTWKPEPELRRAGIVSMRCDIPGTKEKARESGAALRVSRRALPPSRRIEPVSAGADSLEKLRRVHSLTVSPAMPAPGKPAGYERREFPKRSLVQREPRRSSPAASGLPGTHLRPGAPPELKDVVAEMRACAIERREVLVQFPRLAIDLSACVKQFAAPPIAVMKSLDGPTLAGPSCSISRGTSIPVRLPGIPGVLRAGLCASATPVVFLASSDGAPEHRPAEVRFVPADSPFDHTPMALQGSVQPTGDPARPDAIEEHFDSGLEQWVGDLVEWKLDAAGARPAGLALLRPTISLGDYEFEFFTRIEHRAVTFAFRAANVSNYFKVTIAMVESGRHELRRCAVIGGIEEPAAASPLPGVLRPGAAFTVKTRAWQNDFTIWLDGELAAKWTDGRLPIGGIGFMAPRDDRARVYWVRLSQLDGPNSQAASHRPIRSIQ